LDGKLTNWLIITSNYFPALHKQEHSDRTRHIWKLWLPGSPEARLAHWKS